MESNRQKRVSTLFQQELSEIFRKEAAKSFPGHLVTVTEVKVTPDFSTAKIYISIFPTEDKEKLVAHFMEKAPYYRSLLAKSVAKKMRTTPELLIYSDNSLDKMDKIDRALRGEGENPIL